jgi:hypothetical protein
LPASSLSVVQLTVRVPSSESGRVLLPKAVRVSTSEPEAMTPLPVRTWTSLAVCVRVSEALSKVE